MYRLSWTLMNLTAIMLNTKKNIRQEKRKKEHGEKLGQKVTFPEKYDWLFSNRLLFTRFHSTDKSTDVLLPFRPLAGKQGHPLFGVVVDFRK